MIPSKYVFHVSFNVLLYGSIIVRTTSVPAQTATSPYTVVDRGGFYRVWQRTVAFTNTTTGTISERSEGYTELGDGMHYWSDGAWAESKDLIDVLATIS
jgi:hypothetical protein